MTDSSTAPVAASDLPAEPTLVELVPGLEVWTSPERFELFSEIHFIYREIFEDRCYLQHGVTLPSGAVVVDVGANVGLFALFVANECPDAVVLAFEPMLDNLAALRRNVAEYELTRTTVFAHALGAVREDAVPFTFFPRQPGNSTRYPQDKRFGEREWVEAIGWEAYRRLMASRTAPVDVRRYADVVPGALVGAGVPATRAVDLLKVDVEGAELDVLAGLEEDDWARLRQVAVEVQDLHGRLDAVVDLLTARGFEVTVVPHETIAETFRYSMVIALRPAGSEVS